MTSQNETFYEMKNFTMVACGELTGDFNIVEKNSFGFTIIQDKDGIYAIKNN